MKIRAYLTLFLTVTGALMVLAGFPRAAAGEVGPAGFAVALQTLKPGDVLTLTAGEYPVGLADRKAGTATAPIIIKAAIPGTVTFTGGATDGFTLINANYTVLDGMAFNKAGRAGLYVSAGAHITVQNCTGSANHAWGCLTGHSNFLDFESDTFTNSEEQHGIYISGACKNPQVRGCTLSGNAMCGLQLNGLDASNTAITGAVVDGCTFTGNGSAKAGAALNNLTADGTEIKNCTITGNFAGGVSIYHSYGVTISGCTIRFGALQGRHCIGATFNPDITQTTFTYMNCLLQMGRPGPGTHWELDVGKGCTYKDLGGNVVLAPASQTGT